MKNQQYVEASARTEPAMPEGMHIEAQTARISHAILGIVGEAGEVLDWLRDGPINMSVDVILELKEEMGDIYWYLAVYSRVRCKPLDALVDCGECIYDEETATEASVGLMLKATNIMDYWKKCLFYGKEKDFVLLDCMFGEYIRALRRVMTCCGFIEEQILQMNYDKLKARYPDGFSEDNAINRDKGAEKEAMAESTVS